MIHLQLQKMHISEEKGSPNYENEELLLPELLVVLESKWLQFYYLKNKVK